MRYLAMTVALTTTILAAMPAAAGPTGQYVLTAGDQQTNWIVQGTGVVTSWSASYLYEYPVVVLDTIRTTNSAPGSSGAEYTLAGVPTGVTFTNGMGSGQVYDAATDGTFIYVLDFDTGNVVRLDLSYSNPQVLFSLNAADSYLGITYDATNTSLWISTWGSGAITDYSMTGSVLSSFSVPYSDLTSLALDPSDGTLWFGSQAAQGTFYQYSKAGVALGSETYPSLVDQNTLGGEFQVAVAGHEIPALGHAGLGALLLLLAGLGVVALRRLA